MIDLEDRVRRTLSAVAEGTVIGQEALSKGGPTRNAGAVVGGFSFLTTLAVVTAGVLILGAPRQPANQADVSTLASSPPSVAPVEHTLISVDLGALGLVALQADSSTYLAPSGYSELQAFRSASFDFTGPMFWVETYFDGTDWFRAGHAAEGQSVRYGDHEGHLFSEQSLFAFEDGDWDVMVVASEATDIEFRSFVAGLVRDGDGWKATDLPSAIVPISTEADGLRFPAPQAVVHYEFEEGEILAMTGEVDLVHMERKLYDAVLGQGAEPVKTLIGRRDVVVAGSLAMWFESDQQVVIVRSFGIDVVDVVPFVTVGSLPDSD